MPGSLFLCAGIWAYAAGTFDLMKLTLVFAMHFVLPWLFIAAGIWALGRDAKTRAMGSNPFQKVAG